MLRHLSRAATQHYSNHNWVKYALLQPRLDPAGGLFNINTTILRNLGNTKFSLSNREKFI